jgi:pimeloyl-ACP methyl ester carboxylesterase
MTTPRPQPSAQQVESAYAPVNGLKLYYEIHGSGPGTPLILVHGSFGTVDMFAPLLPALSETRPVIAVELQAHGHTADIDRPFSFEAMADDIAAFTSHLGLQRADLLGYSLGGGVALQTAIRHPNVVRKLVVVSAPFKRDGWYPEVAAGMAAVNGEMARTWVGSPMYQAYAAANPNPDDWPNLADKLSALLKQDYDWTTAARAMQAPTLIIVGDADGIRPSHIVEMYELRGGGKPNSGLDPIPDSQLAVLPATTHLSILMRTDLLPPIITQFLDAQ